LVVAAADFRKRWWVFLHDLQQEKKKKKNPISDPCFNMQMQWISLPRELRRSLQCLSAYRGFFYGSFVRRIGGKGFVIFFFLANLFLQLI
jgi:hypothetical protein